MSLGAGLIHQFSSLSHIPGHRKFVKSLTQVEGVQKYKLSQYLQAAEKTEFGKFAEICPDWTWEQFAQKLSITDYDYWIPWIERQKVSRTRAILCDKIERFEPTSGSTSKRKLIPYSRAFLTELDCAASAWIYDLTRRMPGVSSGKHYWSLSWLPNDLRENFDTVSTDDVKIFPAWKQMLLSQVMAVPSTVSHLPTLDEAMTVTLAHLASCKNLSMLSVWSPTFALKLLRDLYQRRFELAEIISRGAHGVCRSSRSVQLLKNWKDEFSSDFFKKLWPELKLVSAWDSSTSAPWALELRELLSHAEFQGKGLWATEGVVTIPFQNSYPLALTSHFYEFRCLKSGEIYPSWALTKGQFVQPIMSNGSGMLRYALPDRLEVTGHIGQCPTFEFQGRIASVDMVGEKIDSELAQFILKKISDDLSIQCISLLGCLKSEQPLPHYTLLARSMSVNSKQNCLTQNEIADALEKHLLQYHHYGLARELGQLGPAQAILRDDAIDFYHLLQKDRMISGSVKIEAVLLCSMPLQTIE